MASKHSGLQNVGGGEGMVWLHVSHSNLKHHSSQLRFSLHTSIEAVKERLSQNSGTAVGSMLLHLFDEIDHKIGDMVDGTLLGFYSPLNGYRIHILDLDPASCTANGWLEDTSLVEKYTITDDEYNKREDTFRKFKEKKIGEGQIWNQHKTDEGAFEEMARSIHVGDRCEVNPGGKRGVVMFVGLAENLESGQWIGLQYDEPVGKHDGMVKGMRYFQCLAGHGVMVRPDKVQVGDYPELDPFDEMDEI